MQKLSLNGLHFVQTNLTPHEVAAILKVSPETVARRFERRPGVLIGSGGWFKRRYRVPRIPREVQEKLVIEIRVQ